MAEQAAADIGKIVDKYRAYSMMGRRRFIQNLKVAAAVGLDMRAHSVVECGVWRGGASFAMMELFPECPEFHMFDSFEGLPEPTERDGQRAIGLSEENLFVAGRNFADHDDVTTSLATFGFSDRTITHKGWFEDTVAPSAIDRPIGILRLDGDWYASTKLVLDRLYDNVVTGGLVIIDDYYDWPGCSQAVHDFLSERRLPDVLMTLANKVVFIRKRAPDLLDRGASAAELDKRRRMQTG